MNYFNVRKIYLLILLAITSLVYSTPGTAQCSHTISLYDSYDDGWHGNNSLDVEVNGTVVLDDITLSSGSGPADYTFQAGTGDAIQVIFSSGSWPSECYYTITNSTGSALVSNYYPESSGTWNGTACCPPGNTNTYGSGSWTGYAYTSNGSGAFNTYLGYVTENEIFDRDMGSGNITGLTTNIPCNNRSNDFAIRYRMNKTFPAGWYNFTIGGDDGIRLSTDGGSSWLISDWSDHSYRTNSSGDVYLDGNYNLVLELYEDGGDSRVSFNYSQANYRAQIESVDFGSTDWCTGEERTVSVDITNVGNTTWTNSGPDINVGIKWNNDGGNWTDFHVRTNAGGHAPGETRTYNLTIPAKKAVAGPLFSDNLEAGTNNLNVSVVSEGCFWFYYSSGTYCGTTLASSPVYTTPDINIKPIPENLTISSDVTICNGSSTQLSGNANGVITTASNPTDYSINDHSTTNSSITISNSGTSASEISSVLIRIDHTYDDDLDISLEAPDGSTIDLSSDNGGSGNNFNTTVFSPSASTSVTNGSAPFNGSYLPEESFSNLTGSANGTWTLHVYDDGGGDHGTLYHWEINYISDVTYSWSPATGLSDPGTNNPYASPASTTSYTLTASAGGCGISDNVTVTVLPPFSAGAISGETSSTQCYNYTPGTLTANPAGGAGTYDYQWQSSPDGSSWSDITGATSQVYTPPVLTGTTHYRVLVNPTGTPDCSGEMPGTNTIVFTILPEFTAGAITSGSETICSGGIPYGIASSVDATGGDGTITYEWRANGSPIPSSNSASYNPATGLTASTTYTRWVKDNACNTSWTQSTGTYTVTVNPDPVNGIVERSAPLSENVCIGEDLTVTVTGASGGTGCTDDIEYKIGISGTAQTYNGTFTTVIPGEYYFRTQRSCSGTGCDSPGWSDWTLLYIVNDNGYWTGIEDHNWHQANNWCGGVPTNTDDVTIPSTADNMPEIHFANAETRDITISTGASLEINNNMTITVSGNFINNGNFSMSNGNEAIVMNGNNVNISTNGNSLNDLIIENASAIVNIQNNFDILGSLDIQEGVLNLGNNNLSIAGDVSVNGAFNAGTGNINLNGNSVQALNTNGTNAVFNDLTINNSSGALAAIVLNSDLYISGTLDLVQGIIYTNTEAHKVSLLDGSSSNPGNANSFIDGEVEKTGTTAFVYPTGDIANIDGSDRAIWAPVETDACTLSTISAIYHYENPPYDWWYHNNNMDTGIDHVTDREYWDLTTDNATPAVTIYWKDNTNDIHSFGSTSGEITPSFVTNNLTIAHYNTNLGKWEDMGADIPSGNIYFDNGMLKTSMNFSSYSPITFASKNPGFTLPVELTEFTAVCKESMVELKWTTASEINNDYFFIEKSKDGITWELIITTAGSGNSNKPVQYTEYDKIPVNGETYYRLTQVDFDGTSENFDVISVNCKDHNPPEITIYPNPFDQEINIVGFNINEEENVQISISDINGKVIRVWETELHESNFHKRILPTDLKPGIYILSINTKSYTEHFKIQRQ